MKFRTLFLLSLVGASLSAKDLDVYLSFGLLSPRKDLSNQVVDSLGQPTGQMFQPASDFRMAGLGVAYTLLGRGAWRLRGSLEMAGSVQDPGATLRYLEYSGLTSHYLQAEGSLKATSLNVGLSAVYVSSGAGEYGVTLERRSQALEFDVAQATVSFPGDTALLSGLKLKKTLADPFLSVHATFVQRYEAFALFSRVSFGIDLTSSPALGGYPESSYQNLDPDLLAALRPRQELKLSLGVRF